MVLKKCNIVLAKPTPSAAPVKADHQITPTGPGDVRSLQQLAQEAKTSLQQLTEVYRKLSAKDHTANTNSASERMVRDTLSGMRDHLNDVLGPKLKPFYLDTKAPEGDKDEIAKVMDYYMHEFVEKALGQLDKKDKDKSSEASGGADVTYI